MNINKEIIIEEFRDELIKYDLNFQEHANGHFTIHNAETQQIEMHIWPTTEKMHIVDGPKVTGMASIKKILFKDEMLKRSEEITDLRKIFLQDYHEVGGVPFRVLTVAIELPSGAIEVITNMSNIPEKMFYYREAYDEQFRLKANPKVKVIGYMLV